MSWRRLALWGLAIGALALLLLLAATVRVVEPVTAIAQSQAPAREGAPPLREDDGGLRVPVAGVDRATLRSNWGEPRGGGRVHQGLDIMAPANSAVVAAGPGRIEKLFYSRGGGGIVLYQRSPDGRLSYYYAHLAGYAPGIAEGTVVRAGELLGYVGDTGNAGKGNFHLHFGVSRMAPGERWDQGTPIDPYPLLSPVAPAR